MYVVIPAGGSGTRLWPLSRAAYPKFLHPLTGDSRTLIQATIDRLAALAPPERTFVVTGGAHVAPIARQIPDVPAANILVEPSPRDSAAAIGLAAAIIARRDPARSWVRSMPIIWCAMKNSSGRRCVWPSAPPVKGI